jgi:hypothetical protein
MTAKKLDHELADKLMLDSCNFLLLLKKAAACRIEEFSVPHIQEGFKWAYSIYEASIEVIDLVVGTCIVLLLYAYSFRFFSNM